MAALVLLTALSCAIAAASAQAVDSTGSYLQRMDRDGDGRVSLDEYLAWMSYAFDARDLDHDGVLSPAELPGGRGKPITRAQHQAILTARFRKQDGNGDGYLSARELAAPPR
ncbi:Ca2+-binding EF-hand superfamily protein [Xanthomonas sp. JAI131]|uniref:EF-hand domain-containing protein n=1 Tax=Xanthomonas sp. JAI131 TaxID=2723067 RepID=UPI0015C8FFAE|nr:EF-hand domain-containing protein [Xanthomonas sp. JAI131]NYF22235.1 Ca2+-binding EF-hand superfamily protein [Xanthomonas sp. JAI131]